MRNNILLLIILCFLGILFITGIFLSEKQYNSISIIHRFKAPSTEFLFGTDAYGRDIFLRTSKALFNTINYALLASIIAIFIGFLLGLIAGYSGGIIDFVIQTLIDVMMSFPSFFLILTIIAAMPQNGWNVIIAIVLSTWPNIAKITRAEILTLKNREFILASSTIGASFIRIVFYHIVPNCINSLIITGIFSFGGAILTESSLSFLKLGINEDIPTLGNLISGGRDVLRSWWISTFPGIVLFLLIFSVNLVGERIREFFDPKN
ncbi:MAG: ABC transporter permease [Candidatus Muirbacterium halophilum]|nr:ABC transporter permease [Candidatus Muirbacterium halophilum]MCK9475023.1 ABC transporter permease [Candidatus Muirbacterium halophilum]